MVDGFMQGLHRSNQHGVSVEFAQHRPYVAGDDVRFVDWKVYGRTDKLHLKQFERETNLDLIVMVDGSGSMAYKSELSPWSKYDAAGTIAAAMCGLALNQRDRAAVWVFDDLVQGQSRLSNAAGHLSDVSTVLKTYAPAIDKPDQPATDLGRVFERVHARLSHRTILVWVSDFFDDPEAIEAGLSRLRGRRHDVLLVQVMDPAEKRFEFRSPTLFVDIETGQKLPADPAALKQSYLEALAEHQKQIGEATRRLGFDHLLIETHQPVGPALSHLMAKRAAAIRRAG